MKHAVLTTLVSLTSFRNKAPKAAATESAVTKTTAVFDYEMDFIGRMYCQFTTNECGLTKGCLFVPKECDVGSNCMIAFSYQVDGNNLVMEISGNPKQDNAYLAVGFSKDSEMGNDMVLFCAREKGVVHGGLAWNGKRPENKILDNADVQNVTSVLVHDIIYCLIRHRLEVKQSDLFNLNSTYVILMAVGPYYNNELHYHNERYVLPATTLTSYVKGVGAVKDPNPKFRTPRGRSIFKATHGISMTLSWAVFLSTGMLFARHKEGPCSSNVVLGLKLWFHYHRTLNLIGIAGTVFGFICILIANEWQWTGPLPGRNSELNWRWGSIHSLVGLVACVVAWIQPLDSMLRCSPIQKRKRMVFNLVHGGLGALAWICAVTAMMIAGIHFKGMFSKPEMASIVYILYLLLALSSLAVIETLSLIREKKSQEEKRRMKRMLKDHDEDEDSSDKPSEDFTDQLAVVAARTIKSGSEELSRRKVMKDKLTSGSEMESSSSTDSEEEVKKQGRSFNVKWARRFQLFTIIFYLLIAVTTTIVISSLIVNRNGS